MRDGGLLSPSLPEAVMLLLHRSWLPMLQFIHEVHWSIREASFFFSPSWEREMEMSRVSGVSV